MKRFFADLHIHVGKSESGNWIKIPTSARLTLRNILEEAKNRKGIEIVGIADAISPLVIKDIEKLFSEGELRLNANGGYQYKEAVTLLLGAEIETREEDGSLAHTLVFLPDIDEVKDFSRHMAQHIRNIHMSTQNAHMPLQKLIETAAAFEALIIPAHVFTPFKSLFGVCTARLPRLLTDKAKQSISAIELGLSADSDMADRLAELADFSFVTNSDAHSVEKIAREYNSLLLAEASFIECKKAFSRQHGRKILANYGLDPHLGKYHATLCLACESTYTPDRTKPLVCPNCHSTKCIKGVYDRIREIADFAVPHHPEHRPPYQYQIPLEFIPGIGKKILTKLLTAFGTEMNILNTVSEEELSAVIGTKLASHIAAARSGRAVIKTGGGGIYGRMLKDI